MYGYQRPSIASARLMGNQVAVRVELGQRRAVVPLPSGHQLGLDAVGAFVRGRDGGSGEREQEAQRHRQHRDVGQERQPPGPGEQSGSAVGSDVTGVVVRGRDGATTCGVGQRHGGQLPSGFVVMLGRSYRRSGWAVKP